MTDVKAFYYFNEALLNMGSISSASELQGYICGKLSGSKTQTVTIPEAWYVEIQRFMDMEYLTFGDEHKLMVSELYTQSLKDLGDSDYAFRPLLPEDEASMQRRTEELAAWCRGFLHGLGSSGLKADDTLGADVADALRDLAKISQAEVEEDESTEEVETDWESLVEYVKVAVLTINQEFGEELKSVH